MVTHLLRQGQQSRTGPFGCSYRDADGVNACAVGACIPDELYNVEMEGKGIVEVNKIYNIFPTELLPLLSECQTLHDCYTPEYWERELAKKARSFGLQMPVVK
jgi:hypothetical protein